MNFRYPNITAGYLGYKVKEPTLNSAFFAKYFNHEYDLNKIIIFPQRVLKQDFFDELRQLEYEQVSVELGNNCNYITKNINELLIKSSDSRFQRSFINVLNVMLRYGLFEEINRISILCIKKNFDSSDALEVELIRAIARNYLNSSIEDQNLENDLKFIGEKAIHDSNLSDRVRILALNYLVVIFYRFGIKVNHDAYLKQYYETLLNLVDNQVEDLSNIIRLSVAYRGLAMVKEFGAAYQTKFIDKAELLARQALVLNQSDELVAKENLYTCLQTLSKWNTHLGKYNTAEKNLIEMIELDPFDSTAYGELAFFLENQGRFNQASEHFKKASELGPAGVGMHTYYYAKCLQAMGKNNDALNILYNVTCIDKDAVSPWLDIFEYKLSLNQRREAKKIAQTILASSVYVAQLEENEINTLKDLLHN